MLKRDKNQQFSLKKRHRGPIYATIQIQDNLVHTHNYVSSSEGKRYNEDIDCGYAVIQKWVTHDWVVVHSGQVVVEQWMTHNWVVVNCVQVVV